MPKSDQSPPVSKTNRWVGPLALAAALLTLFGATWFTYQNVKQFAETARWISHTREVMLTTQTIMRKLNKAESAGRGFMLTREPEYRTQFDLAIKMALEGKGDLRKLTSHDDDQRKRVQKLATLIEPQVELLRTLASRQRSPELESAEADTLLARETSQMDAIRDLVAEIEQVEDILLIKRTSDFGNRLSATRTALILSALISSMVVLGTFFLLRRHWHLQAASQTRELRDHKEKENLSRYNQRLLESTGEGIYGIDLNGDCTFINKAGALTLGGKPKDFLGENMHQRVHAKQADGRPYPLQDCPIYKASQSGDGCRIDDEVFWRMDGVSVPVEYSSFPLNDESGEREGAVVTFTDITTRLKSRHDLQLAKEAAESANESKSQFLANMSHELRTPLNAVIMYSELLAEEAEDEGVPDFIPDLFKIRSAGKHLLELVNGVLDLSKVEAGKMELYAEDFDIPNLINEIITTVQPLIEKNQNEVKVNIAPGVSRMNGDITKIRQVLYNLVSNASKFTKDGVIELRISRDAKQKEIIFKVVDSGIGMTPEQVERLFQPFMQADVSTTRKFGGTGLGLAIIKRFTDLMQGDVDVESVLDEGTTFTVRLPDQLKGLPLVANPDEDDRSEEKTVAAGQSPELLGVEADTDGRKKPIVLVVDDDPAIRDILARVLIAEGMQPVTAADGEEGLKRAREIIPDLIILDIRMPRIDGWSMLSTIKADDQLSAIPVIIQSVSDDRDLGYMLGATEYLVKPVNRDKLVTLLHRYMPQGKPKNVLVVDDDEATRRAITQTLQRQGWQVDQAENGVQAMTQLAERQPAVILLDLMMPEMDGFEFLEQFHANDDWQDITVIVLTAKDLTPAERDVLNGGVERVLAKGTVNRDHFLEKVKRAVATIAFSNTAD
ncbi:response regulator [Mariniblastus sp.]|nr:response regulator [Mariniblastus sp.]